MMKRYWGGSLSSWGLCRRFKSLAVDFEKMLTAPYTPASGGQASFFFPSLEK
jgi:hypothetical protein